MPVDFDTFIKENAVQSEEDEIDWERRRSEWLSCLEHLYDLVREYLSGYSVKDLVRIAEEPVSLHEEHRGRYGATALFITVGKVHVEFRPIGTLVVGAKGRVDMISSTRSVSLLLVDKEATGIAVRGRGGLPEQPASTAEAVLGRGWAWKILERTPKVMFLEFNEESFKQAFLAIASDGR